MWGGQSVRKHLTGDSSSYWCTTWYLVPRDTLPRGIMSPPPGLSCPRGQGTVGMVSCPQGHFTPTHTPKK